MSNDGVTLSEIAKPLQMSSIPLSSIASYIPQSKPITVVLGLDLTIGGRNVLVLSSVSKRPYVYLRRSISLNPIHPTHGKEEIASANVSHCWYGDLLRVVTAVASADNEVICVTPSKVWCNSYRTVGWKYSWAPMVKTNSISGTVPPWCMYEHTEDPTNKCLVSSPGRSASEVGWWHDCLLTLKMQTFQTRWTVEFYDMIGGVSTCICACSCRVSEWMSEWVSEWILSDTIQYILQCASHFRLVPDDYDIGVSFNQWHGMAWQRCCDEWATGINHLSRVYRFSMPAIH